MVEEKLENVDGGPIYNPPSEQLYYSSVPPGHSSHFHHQSHAQQPSKQSPLHFTKTANAAHNHQQHQQHHQPSPTSPMSSAYMAQHKFGAAGASMTKQQQQQHPSHQSHHHSLQQPTSAQQSSSLLRNKVQLPGAHDASGGHNNTSSRKPASSSGTHPNNSFGYRMANVPTAGSSDAISKHLQLHQQQQQLHQGPPHNQPYAPQHPQQQRSSQRLLDIGSLAPPPPPPAHHLNNQLHQLHGSSKVPASSSVASLPHQLSATTTPQLALMKDCDIEKFAQDNLNLHSKGIFRKKASVRDMLSWTADAISRPMLAVSRDKQAKKQAIEMFKLVQIYMGDRKARAGMSLNSVISDIAVMAVAQPPLRDELYVQMCRQTTENHTRESLIRGWELMAICLSFIAPSITFQPALLK